MIKIGKSVRKKKFSVMKPTNIMCTSIWEFSILTAYGTREYIIFLCA